jgi:hypothetical protein
MVITNQNRLGQSNARIHKRLDDFIDEDYVKSEECGKRCGECYKKCEQRYKDLAAAQGSVKPVVAFVWIPLAIEAMNLIGQNWSHIVQYLRGG